MDTDGSTMLVSHKTARADPLMGGFANSPWTGKDEVGAIALVQAIDELIADCTLVLELYFVHGVQLTAIQALSQLPHTQQEARVQPNGLDFTLTLFPAIFRMSNFSWASQTMEEK
jgi:hypothetical protein